MRSIARKTRGLLSLLAQSQEASLKKSAAAEEYAGETGRVTVAGPGLDRTIVDVRIDGKNVDTVFDEEDVTPVKKPA